MRTLIIPNIPGRTLMRLRRLARVHRRSTSDEAKIVLRDQLCKISPAPRKRIGAIVGKRR